MIDLQKLAKKQKIKYFLISFVDLYGVLRSKLVPTAAIKGMQKEGAGFAGFAAWLDMVPADPDMFAIPDANSLIQLPWKPEIGWLASDLWMDKKQVEASPRVALKKQIAKAVKKGFRVKTGVECEFFLINPDGSAIADAMDYQAKPCYDQQALMRQYHVISEICDCMQKLEWGAYQNDHEDANGQFEMNWNFADVLQTADRHAFFKFMVKSIAEKHSLRATFMPKPFADLTGNGCHSHISFWNKGGSKNLFEDKKNKLGLSKMAYHFLGGVLHYADSLCAIFNPTVNSFKRIDAPRTRSGATWSPNAISYSGNNRTHLVRVPDIGRFELRLMDGATNPYLAQAGIIAAGLDGIENKRDAGEPLDLNMYDEKDFAKAGSLKKLPTNLLDALRLLDKNIDLKTLLGKELVNAYIKLKKNEWQEYSSHLSSWERKATLDC